MAATIDFLARWGHILVGIAWIGLLYYFNFVQGSYFKEADDDARGEKEPSEDDGAAGPGVTAEDAPAPAAPLPAPSTGVRVYRRTADGAYLEPLVASPLATEAYLDAAVEHGQELSYELRTVLRGEPSVEGQASTEVCATFLDRLLASMESWRSLSEVTLHVRRLIEEQRTFVRQIPPLTVPM